MSGRVSTSGGMADRATGNESGEVGQEMLVAEVGQAPALAGNHLAPDVVVEGEDAGEFGRVPDRGLDHVPRLDARQRERVAVPVPAVDLVEVGRVAEAELEPRLARVVECRFFGGLTEEEIAEALGITVRTVQRDWAKARMLLQRELDD